MKDKVVILDGNNYAHKAYHSYRNMNYKGESVALLYGFICMLRAIVNSQRPDRMIICWDDQKHKGRLALLPDYKGKRKAKRGLFDYDDFYRQMDILRKAIHLLGVTQVYGGKMEADDYIHWAARSYKERNWLVVIVSSDKDFHQELAHKNVSIWDEKRKVRLHKGNLTKYYNYEAHQCVDYLSLLGDVSDNIPGYRGIGEVKAKAFLQEFGSISSFLSNEANSYKGIGRKVLLELQQKNRTLIDLNYFYLKFIKGKHNVQFYKNTKKPKFKKTKFYEWASKYNFVSLMSRDFVKPFNKE